MLRLIQERGGDSLSPVILSRISFQAETGRPRPCSCPFLNQPCVHAAFSKDLSVRRATRGILPKVPALVHDLAHRSHRSVPPPSTPARRPARERISTCPRRVARMPRRASRLVIRIAVSTLVPANSATVARVSGITRPNFSQR